MALNQKIRARICLLQHCFVSQLRTLKRTMVKRSQPNQDKALQQARRWQTGSGGTPRQAVCCLPYTTSVNTARFQACKSWFQEPSSHGRAMPNHPLSKPKVLHRVAELLPAFSFSEYVIDDGLSRFRWMPVSKKGCSMRWIEHRHARPQPGVTGPARRTVEASPSTAKHSPSVICASIPGIFTTAGRPYSRATIAPCER